MAIRDWSDSDEGSSCEGSFPFVFVKKRAVDEGSCDEGSCEGSFPFVFVKKRAVELRRILGVLVVKLSASINAMSIVKKCSILPSTTSVKRGFVFKFFSNF